MDEQPLNGGNTTVVVRVDNTVRRPAGHWTPAVHRLLRHLEGVDFAGAPRVLGVDDQNREVLGFVRGEVGTLSLEAPLAPWFRTPEACRAIGRWIRAFQEAQSEYRPDPAEPWRRAAGTVLTRGQVVVHHDVSPYNTVRRPDGGLTVLDWDFARPGGPLEDLAWAAWRWVPLMTGTWWQVEYGITAEDDIPTLRRRNLDALMDGYTLPADARGALGTEILHQITRHADDLEDMACTDPAFARLVDRHYAQAARDDASWFLRHRNDLGLA